MKARIFCEREVPPGRQFNGAVDYHYNEIRKLMLTIFSVFLVHNMCSLISAIVMHMVTIFGRELCF